MTREERTRMTENPNRGEERLARFHEALAAIGAGDVRALESLLARHPELVRDRLEEAAGTEGEGYFARPYLLGFVAENPIRTGKLPANIVEVTRAILRAAKREGVESFGEQVDFALSLVASGRVAREQGVQGELIDVLCEAGADPERALLPALAHREVAAVERLLARGARRTLLAAVATGQKEEVARLARQADRTDRQAAFAAAALYGQADTLALLIDSGVDVDAYNPPGLHPHGTALHQAVAAGSLAAVQVLASAGADLGARDSRYSGTPLGWAEHLGQTEIAAYLRGCAAKSDRGSALTPGPSPGPPSRPPGEGSEA
jgi:hypothetical protein